LTLPKAVERRRIASASRPVSSVRIVARISHHCNCAIEGVRGTTFADVESSTNGFRDSACFPASGD
jgi:hypothetical protein